MISVHPLFLIMLVLWVASGQVGPYAIMMASLLWHELGHMIAAKCCGVRVDRITLLPYGGRMTLDVGASYAKRVVIACGGPVFTLLAYILGYWLHSPWQDPWQQMQVVLLLVNSLPIYPLDGGQIVCNSLLCWKPKQKIYEAYLSLSFCFLTIIVVVAMLMLPQSLILVVLSTLLWSEVMGEWKIRKYRSAYEKIVLKRLT